MHVLSLYYLNFSQKQPVIVLFMYAKRERDIGGLEVPAYHYVNE